MPIHILKINTLPSLLPIHPPQNIHPILLKMSIILLHLSRGRNRETVVLAERMVSRLVREEGWEYGFRGAVFGDCTLLGVYHIFRCGAQFEEEEGGFADGEAESSVLKEGKGGLGSIWYFYLCFF
jgi:hypothetical protein